MPIRESLPEELTADNMAHGFVLSESAIYSFLCQDVFPDIISFAAAIPDHLKSLFLIPIRLERTASSKTIEAASKIAEGYGPTGDTPDAELFSYQTFVNDDNEPTVPSASEGSIFEINDADDMTHHQENNFDQNIEVPTDTSYQSEDMDSTQYTDYPYRGEAPYRHSSRRRGSDTHSYTGPRILFARLNVALKPTDLQPRTPQKIKDNAKKCAVKLISYDERNRVYTFEANCGNGPHVVQASLSEIDNVALSCDCNFWRWNGPEFHAQENKFMLGQPFGSASVPNIRDPEKKYWLCKHTYSVLRRLDNFVQEVVDENWEDGDDKEKLLEDVDEEWDRLEEIAEVPLDQIEEEDEEIDADWDGDEEPEEEVIPEEKPEEKPEEPEPESSEETEDSEDLEEPAEEPEDFSGESEETEEPDKEEPEDYSGDDETPDMEKRVDEYLEGKDLMFQGEPVEEATPQEEEEEEEFDYSGEDQDE